MTGILTLPPEQGEVSELLCDMDECYCPLGRAYFEPIPNPMPKPIPNWICLKHFDATMRILEPTLLVLQGERVQDWIAPALGVMEERSPHLAQAEVAWGRIVVCRFSHPSARGKLNWRNLGAPYLRQIAEPTLAHASALL